uniref:Uncharacterized protein n=1 Tax=Panagrolaimus superbus TaxID=310955 RepID=A0A914YTQ2_9BILA
MAKNAKIWSSTTPSATTQPSATPASEGTKTGSIVWIVLGVLLFIIVIGLIALGIYCFCIKKQKKAAEIFDGKPKEVMAESKNLETRKINVEPDAGKLKEIAKTKKETVEEQPAKQKKEVVKPKEKPTKNEIKNVPAKKAAAVEPTLDDPTTEASVCQRVLSKN